MPVYVPNYDNDIFVSYAQVNNQPLPGADTGWVTTLINGLKIKLGENLGRKDAFTLWMDYKLSGHKPVTPDIDEQLNNSATFVLILSRGYLASQWCRLELNTFINKVRKGSGRIFMVEYEFIPREKKPPEFQDLLGFPFWITDENTGRTSTLKPNHDEYHQKLDDLASQLADKLDGLQALANQGGDNIEPSSKQVALKILALETERTQLQQEINFKSERYKNIHVILPSLGDQDTDQQRKQTLKDELDQLDSEIEQLETKVAQIDSDLKQLNKLEKLETKVDQIDNELTQLEANQ